MGGGKKDTRELMGVLSGGQLALERVGFIRQGRDSRQKANN